MGKRLAILIILTLSSALYAQSAKELKAFQLYKKAKSLMEQKKFLDACNLLDQAYKTYPQPHILARKAECLEAMDEPEQALEVLQSIKGGTKAFRLRVKHNIERLKVLLKKPVKVTVVTPHEGAKVSIDGVQKCNTPCTINLPRGKHKFVIIADGYKPFAVERRIKGFSGMVIEAKLEPLLAEVAFVVQPQTEGLKVLLDGEPVKSVPETGTWKRKMKIGRHTLTVTAPGYNACIKEFDVPEPTKMSVTCTLEEVAATYWTKDKIIGWSLVAGSAISLGIGSFLIADYYKDKNIAKSEHKIMKSNKHIFGGIFLGAGVAAGGTALYFLLRSPEKSDQSSVLFIPSFNGINALIRF